MIEVKVLKANEGDALFVACGENKKFNIMIDMGVSKTYWDYVRPILKNLNSQGEKINLLVISHIDSDHIAGALNFIQENQEGKIIKVDEVWHNTYRHLQFKKEKKKKISVRTNNELKGIITSNLYKTFNTGEKDISINQGISLGGYLLKYNYIWNKSFNTKAVCIKNNNEIKLDNNVKIILISPNKEKLDKLSTKWLNDINKKYNINEIGEGEIWDDALEYYMHNLRDYNGKSRDISNKKINLDKLEALAAKEEKDTSETNGSSIAFILEYKDNCKVKKLLFLGDAHEDIIFNRLNKLKEQGYELKFDLVKISHHGSNKNISRRLINLIQSQKFIISTDGKKHNHPHMEAMAKILTRENKKKVEIIFNYDISQIKLLDNKELKEKYNYDLRVLDDTESIIL